MKTRTFLYLCHDGVVRCRCGAIGDFIEDIVEFVVPLLEDYIYVEFNDRKVYVLKDDDAEKIYSRYLKELYGRLKEGF